jgi:hypothetical protein
MKMNASFARNKVENATENNSAFSYLSKNITIPIS